MCSASKQKLCTYGGKSSYLSINAMTSWLPKDPRIQLPEELFNMVKYILKSTLTIEIYLRICT